MHKNQCIKFKHSSILITLLMVYVIYYTFCSFAGEILRGFLILNFKITLKHDMMKQFDEPLFFMKICNKLILIRITSYKFFYDLRN